MTATGYLARNEVHVGDVRALARRLEPASVQTIVTSPPYFGLRSYLPADHHDKAHELGGEATPEEFVANAVAVFAALRDCLKDDGTVWLNLGDSYAMSTKGAGGAGKQHTNQGSIMADRSWAIPSGLKPKDLIGIPWRVAFALQADGWYLRSDIIWHKPNPMPESVTDRPTRAHEYLFLIAKGSRYYYDATAIAERIARPLLTAEWGARKANGAWPGSASQAPSYHNASHGIGMSHDLGGQDGTRNKRSVWTVPPAQFADAHYATFSPDLIRPCILAGSRPGDLVLDPFSGSGTTGEVAHEEGRDYLGIDLDERAVRWYAERRARLPVGRLAGC